RDEHRRDEQRRGDRPADHEGSRLGVRRRLAQAALEPRDLALELAVAAQPRALGRDDARRLRHQAWSPSWPGSTTSGLTPTEAASWINVCASERGPGCLTVTWVIRASPSHSKPYFLRRTWTSSPWFQFARKWK